MVVILGKHEDMSERDDTSVEIEIGKAEAAALEFVVHSYHAADEASAVLVPFHCGDSAYGIPA